MLLQGSSSLELHIGQAPTTDEIFSEYCCPNRYSKDSLLSSLLQEPGEYGGSGEASRLVQ